MRIVGIRQGLVAVVARSTAQGGPFPAALETCATHKALMPFDAELNRATTPQRQPTPAEPLFEFYLERDHARWLCELRDHGAYDLEAQFLAERGVCS